MAFMFMASAMPILVRMMSVRMRAFMFIPMMGVMRMAAFFAFYAHLRAENSAARIFFNFQLPSVQPKFFKFGLKLGGINAQIYQRAQVHVAADSGKAVVK